MNNVPRTEPGPRPPAGGPPRPSRAVPRTAGRGLPGSRRPEGGWVMLEGELEFLSGTAGFVSLLAQFEASYPADG